MGNVAIAISSMTDSKPIYLQLQIFQWLLALAPLCLASLPSAMLEMWHIVLQGWGWAFGSVSRTVPAHGAHQEP